MRDELVAIFADPDAAARGLAALRINGITTARIASPAPFPAVHDTGHPGPWRALGWIALVGGLTGLACAIALEVVTSQSMNQIVGGKPVISWTAFGVVMFELTMLLAGISTLISMVVLAAITRRKVARRARDAVSSERIVVIVPVAAGDAELRETIARHLGDALEVQS